ncbi:sugar ABC transporter substrate-binding protein [Marinitoga sp. 1135]|uniref:ABC-type sugar transport system, periplasmic component n=1 Tax=Marinitoga piezophila (strain DSM 14283 / JCM 11233 / KA3) TaxID=443254 RepID=H2J7H8_MARPK|nr:MULTISPECIES: extracellular solute-binding protein [Marinitoga]AEX86471.1 ABC-type sugar transport system, periplasmic component [Marinitoga piezophila KA3]APT76855.1 sugar ABC transporter substrate-binding protein [Marinitoga sp. 1137]NUU96611.1 sugar ABC transporter substrate-binding protein [Marinitoga sp. 1135]NUU98547.1 sugar ABC transporter substrate-binding protein [Marinitoga sp. 1138]
MKKIILVSLIISIVVFSFAIETLVVSSRLWTPPTEKEFIINEIIKPFEDMYNCKVKFQTMDDQSIMDQVDVQVRTNKVTTDVIILYASNMPKMVDKGYVYDLTPYVEKWTDRTFSKGFDSMTMFNGRRYFLPVGADVYLTLINKKALKYKPENIDINNMTWEQLAEWANLVAKAEGEGKFAVTGVPMKSLIYQIGAIALSYGADWPNLDNPGSMAAWYLIYKMKDAFSPAIKTYDDTRPPMKRGETWMTVAHCARVGEVYNSNPTQFIVAPAPKGPAGRGSVAGTSGFAIVKGTKHFNLALKFLEYMTRPDIMLKASKGTGGFIPPVDEAIKYLGNDAQDEIIKNAVTVMNTGVLSYIAPIWKDWGQVKLVYDDLFKKMILEDKKFEPDLMELYQFKIDAMRK